MSNLQALFAEAVRLHQQHQLAQAKALYLQILAELPDNINVLANIAIVCRDLGELAEAERYGRQAVAAAPDDPAQHLNLGAILEAKQNFSEAKSCYEKALSIAPSHPKILNNLGKLLHQTGQKEQGLHYLLQAVRIEPNYPSALNNLGVISSEDGEFEHAAYYLQKCVVLAPDNTNFLYNLAGVHNANNDVDKAKDVLARVIALEPGHQAAGHMLAALSGHTPASAPRKYIEETFDKYSGRFDNHIRERLGYTAPHQLNLLVNELLEPDTILDIGLDLGCGTGLSGLPFRSKVRELIGVDVSSGMLAKAKEKNIYDQLIQDEIIPFLHRDTKLYNLFILADVLVYLGALEQLFANIQQRAHKQAIICLSLEKSSTTATYALNSSGRFAHNSEYVMDTGRQAGFTLHKQKLHPLRKEHGEWLPGELLVFVRD
jgi:predicted TPR repeat methyltransferase